ncbi:tetratricopeptide repeat protein [Pseudonocardia sp. C8]|uniref:tetratricopeptide repeat protein n=1 Tax=Pseudonocardia sp. C8 TaxID=2762759 RepID=UPI001642A63F|nr:tetratricopeptide repeat protein [Pseudonocardia sp. C8]MBC3189920.1 tetratricopeptide repeat protein [Pseudonocardia sp. C8]
MHLDALPWTTGDASAPADRWERATYLFDSGDHVAAARVLAELVTEQPAATAIRLLLARAYYHSAQLGRAETELRALLDVAPSDGYAHLLLGRTLQRRSRHDEAAPHLRLAAAMGVTDP